MRRPTLASTFELDRKTKGLSGVVAGVVEFEECVIRDKVEGVDLLVAGQVPANPLELLSSHKFKDLLERLSKEYDHIIIDSAPTQSVSDSLVLSTVADMVVYVIKADATSATAAKKGIQRLRNSGAELAGVILNHVDLEKNSYYDSDYYNGYYQTYQYKEDSKS